MEEEKALIENLEKAQYYYNCLLKCEEDAIDHYQEKIEELDFPLDFFYNFDTK